MNIESLSHAVPKRCPRKPARSGRLNADQKLLREDGSSCVHSPVVQKCSKSPGVAPKRVPRCGKAGSLNWCKAMQPQEKHEEGGECRASSHAGGPGFESLRAHHPSQRKLVRIFQNLSEVVLPQASSKIAGTIHRRSDR